MESTVSVIDLALIGFGLSVGWWMGVVRERDRQQQIRRRILAARLRRTA